MDSLHDLARSPFLDLASDLADALVYLDAGSAQFVQANLGASFLLGLGAAHLCDLEHASCQDAQLPEMCGVEVQTLVIAVTRLLTDSHPLVLKACLAHAGVTKVLLLSAVSELAHACIPATALGADAYSEYSQMLQQDIMDSREADASMQGKQGKPEEALHPPSVIHTPVEVVVEVKAFPLHICALDAGAFVLPAACAAATQARAGGVAAGLCGATTGLEAPQGVMSQGMTLLAHTLAGVAGQLGSRMEVFACGPVAQELGRELASVPLPAPPPSSPASSAPPSTSHASGPPADLPRTLGVVLVDRSLDLVTPSSHPDSLCDCVMASLARAEEVGGQRASASSGRRGPPPVLWRSLDVRVAVPGLSHLLPLAAAGASLSPSSQGVQAGQGWQPLGVEARLPAAAAPGPQGCELVTPWDKAMGARMEQVATKKSKDALALLRKWLKQALAAERLSPSARSKAGPVQAAELLSLAQDLGSQKGSALRQRSTLALVHAAAAVLDTPPGVAPFTRWEAAGSLERQLLGMMCSSGLGLEEQSQAVADVVVDALAQASAAPQALLGVADILALLPLLYSLHLDSQAAAHPVSHTAATQPPSSSPSGAQSQTPPGPFTPEDEARVRAAVAAGVAEVCAQARGRSCLGWGERLLWQQVAAGVQQQRLQVDALFERLRYIAGARQPLQALRRVTTADMFSEGSGAVWPLLRQLVRRVLRDDELPDLVQPNSHSLGGLLSKGLGRLGLPGTFFGAVAGAVGTAPRPMRLHDCSHVLVFVVGGISAPEIREVQLECEELAGRGGPRVYVGGTALVGTLDVVQQLMAAV